VADVGRVRHAGSRALPARPDVGRLACAPGATRRRSDRRIGAAHDPGDAATPHLREFWYAIVLIEGQTEMDLGTHDFSETTTTGRVVDDVDGRPVVTRVDFDDVMPHGPESPLCAPGGSFRMTTTDEGRFAFAFAKRPCPQLPEPPAEVRDFYVDGALWVRGLPTPVRPVRLGGHYDVSVPRRAEPPEVATTLVYSMPAEGFCTVFDLAGGNVRRSSAHVGENRRELLLKPGAYRAEWTDGPERFATEDFEVGSAGGVVELHPKFGPGRRVRGVASGRLTRVLSNGFDGVPEHVDGPFELDGLPPTGEITLRIDNRTIVVPADSGSPYVIP
jgi:hypothetical protein